MSNNGIIIFRVDGGKVWGVSMGHVKRTLLLAARLAGSCKALFLMRDYSDGVSFVRKQGFTVETIPSNADTDACLIAACDKYMPSKVIIDLPVTPYTAFFEHARDKKIQTIVFDITGKCSGMPDVIINDSFVNQFTCYPQIGPYTRLACGPQYFIMESFHDIVSIREEVENVMITLGGADPAGLTLKIIQALSGYKNKCRFNIVLGPAFSDKQIVSDLAKSMSCVSILENPVNFIELLSFQDIVISAAGRTLYECAYFGRPVIIVPSIEHEAVTADGYTHITGSTNVGIWNDHISSTILINALERYINDFEFRKHIFMSSRELVDGLGMQRVLTIINAKKSVSH